MGFGEESHVVPYVTLTFEINYMLMNFLNNFLAVYDNKEMAKTLV